MEIKLINPVFFYRRRLLTIIMRVFLFFCCTLAFSFAPNNVISQNSKIKINVDKILTVDEIFDIIDAQTDYRFIYHENLFKDFPRMYLKKGTIRLNKLLKECLPSDNLNIIVSTNNTILINKKSKYDKKLQKKTSGTVTDKEGVPMAGVTVLIKGTNDGAITDYEGKYNLDVPSPENVLVFSFLGYEIQEIKTDNKAVINVVLNELVTSLDEVLLTGYQKISVNKSTGATNTVKGETIERKGNSNLLQSLEGQVAGLGLYSDPTEEGSTKFDVRGVTSINGDSRPLIVVDGFPMEGDISTINPHEIESVNILKDAASSSIYGARAANGVIVITTKKGKSGKLNISYRSVLTTSHKPDLSYRLNRVSSSDLVDIQEMAALSSTNVHTYEYWLNTNPATGRRFFANASNIVYETVARVNEGLITQEQADAIYANLKTKDNTKQFEKYFLQLKFEQQHNISISGGGDRNTFRTSLNYTKNQFEWTGSQSDRFIFDLINNFKINDKTSIDIIGNVTFNHSKSTPVPNNLVFGGVNSYEEIIDTNGNYLPVRLAAANFGTNNGGVFGGKEPLEIERLIDAGLLDESYYPLKELGAYTTDNTGISVRLQAMLNTEFTKSLKGQFAFQYESGNSNNTRLSSKNSFEMVSLINNTTPLSYTGDINELNVPLGGRIVEANANRNSYTLRGQLDFNQIFNDHEVLAIIGSEIRNVFNTQTVVDKLGYDDSTLLFKTINRKDLEGTIDNVYIPTGSIAGGLEFNDDFIETKNRYFSLYGNFTYGFKNKYILSGSARIDQSNLFGTDPKYRYKPFWSLGGKWRASEESFFNSSFIDRLDFRLTYGVNGNISNEYGPFNIARALYPYRSGYIQSLAIETPAILDLRWERTATTNYGVDLDIFKNRIGIGFDYYIKKTDDLIANGKANPTLGFSNLVRNDANITNKGIEVTLNTKNIQSQNFSWSTFITFRHNKNSVTKAFSDEQYAYFAAGLRNYEGAPANTFWHFDWNGLNEDGYGTIKKSNGNIAVLDGSFSPLNSVDLEDMIDAGTTNPIYSGAITNTFNYKNLAFSFMFIGNGGHVLLSDSYNGDFIGRTPTNINSDAAYAWKEAGDENITDIPILSSSSYGPSITRRSTKNIVDGDYIKLREVILTYSLGQSLLKGSMVDNILFNLRANNLFYVAKNKKGIDPEGHGVGARFFPTVPSYTLGVTVNF